MSDTSRSLAATRRPIEVLARPFVHFAKVEASSGLLLLAGTIAALIWANSSCVQSYDAIWSAKVSVAFGRFALTETRHEWINDGLMAVFFLLVGLEIKREVCIGELSSLRQAAFPLIAAIGGSVFPAFLYLLIAHGMDTQKGWAIPTATDIAFVLAVLAMLGSRVPVSLKVFVTALAIVDDLIAVMVIAIFYTDRIQLASLALGLAGVGLCLGMNLLGVRNLAVYAIIGVCVWYAVLKSGVHATVAGVLLAFTIPARTHVERDSFLKRSRRLIDRIEAEPAGSFEARSAIHALERELESVESPLHRLEHLLHPWVSFGIMPLFAFANAGVRIWENLGAAVKHPVSIGVAVGLFVGKPLGIWLSARMAGESPLASPPPDLSWRALFGGACLSGIGFTMALFIATLAFGEGGLLDMAKIGILAGSLTSGACGSMFLIHDSGSTGSRSGPGPETPIE